MSSTKSNGWTSVIELVSYVLFFAAWMIFWLVTLYANMPINYLLSFVPLLFVLWKVARKIPRKFIYTIIGLLFVFFVIFDFLNGSIPRQMDIAVKYDALAVYQQWGRSLFAIGLANYLFDTFVDSLVGVLIVVVVWRIVMAFKKSINN